MSFLFARLAREGMLNTLDRFESLESVIVGRYVVPPSLWYLRLQLDMQMFDAALDKLRAKWRSIVGE